MNVKLLKKTLFKVDSLFKITNKSQHLDYYSPFF